MQATELSTLLRRALEPRLDHLLELFNVVGWQEDPEGLHQVRVASRRVRAVLDLVEPEQYPDLKRRRHRLRRLTRILSATRELDVHVGILETLKGRDSDPVHQAVAEHVLEQLDRRRRKARAAMTRRLQKIDYSNLNSLRDAPNLPGSFLQTILQGEVWACLEPWIRRVEDLLPSLLDQEDTGGLHGLRLQVKRLRYTLEILEPAFPSSLYDCLQGLKALQTTLGNHHDHAMLETHLWEIHALLTANQRTVLASTILGLLGMVVEDRRTYFDHFRVQGQEHRKTLLFFRLRQALLSPAQPPDELLP